MAWKSRKQERREEKEREWAEQQRLDEIERCRKEALSMYERIEESDASLDVKDILHRIATALNLEP